MKKVLFSLFLAISISGLTILGGENTEASPRGVGLPANVSVDTVFPEANYELNNNMLIASGVKVTFEPGCVITVPESTNYIGVRGELYMEGTAAKPIVMKSEVGDPEKGMYSGIHFYPGSLGRMNHTGVLNAEYGASIHPDVNITIRDCEFRNCSNSGVYLLSYIGDYHPEDVTILRSKFIDNIVSIREDGINTTIDSCLFERSYYSALEVSHGLYPSSTGLVVEDSTFRANRRYDILLNTTMEGYRVINPTIRGCKFDKGMFSYHSIYSPGLVSDVLIRSNTMYRSMQAEKISLIHGRDITISWNRLYGYDGDYYQETILDLWKTDNISIEYNTFYGSEPYRGNTKCLKIEGGNDVTVRWNIIHDSCAAGIKINNCTDVTVEKNDIQGGEYCIYVARSAPVVIVDNIVRSGDMSRGYGIIIQSASLSRKTGDVEILNNSVEDCRRGIYTNSNTLSRLIENNVIDCVYAYHLDTLWEDHVVYIENCSAFNSSMRDIYFEGYQGNMTVHALNCSMNLSRIESEVNGLHHDMDLYWSSYIRATAVDELGAPDDFTFTLTDDQDMIWYQEVVNGASDLLEGPPLHFFQNWSVGLIIVDPHAALMKYEMTSGTASHSGTVNLTKYTELYAVLDHAPIFNDPSPVHFNEDTVLSFDAWDWFSDMDDIEVNEIAVGANLSVNGSSITNLHANWTGQENVTFRAVDTFGNYTDGTVTFIVDPVQDPPLIIGLPAKIIMIEDTLFTINLSRYIVDGDGDNITFRVVGDENLSLYLDDISMLLKIIPKPDYSGGASWFDVFFNDSKEEVHQRVNITVEPINDPPFFTIPLDWNVTVNKGELTTIDISSMYGDVDDSDLIFSTDSEYVTVFSGKLLILFPEDSEYTVRSVNIRLEDPSGANTTAAILIFIENRSIIEPPEERWEITHVDLHVDDEGDWEIDVYGAPNMSLYIVIDDIGSFKFEESQHLPGNYSVDLDSDLFEAGTDYQYYFTNVTDGPDLDPTRTGTVSQPGSEDDEKEFPWPAVIASIIVGSIIIIVFILGLKAKAGGEFEE